MVVPLLIIHPSEFHWLHLFSLFFFLCVPCSLQRWAKEWTKFLRSGTEYGTSQACWHSFCREAERISDIHMEIRTKLVEDVQTNVKSWQKESFHKQTLPPGFKETRQFEADFLKAQKPWAKKYKRVMDGKKEYHSACKSERSARTAQQNAKTADAADKTSADQVREPFPAVVAFAISLFY